MRLELRLEAGDAPPVGHQDENFGALMLADRVRLAAQGCTRKGRQ